jgi:hypothetical protein
VTPRDAGAPVPVPVGPDVESVDCDRHDAVVGCTGVDDGAVGREQPLTIRTKETNQWQN